MFTTNKDILWESSDAQTLRAFLDSSVGQRAIACVLNEAPSLLDGGDVNKTLVRNGEVKGFTAAIQTLFRLCHEQPPQPKVPEAYPSLDNDDAWKELEGGPVDNQPTN